VVIVGFALAVVLSVFLATPRIAIASGTAFLTAQLLDVAIFDRMRRSVWWKAPLVSSFVASALDTVLFFTLAFSVQSALLGASDPYAIEAANPLGIFGNEAPRWMSWALGDFLVKISVAVLLLVPYRFLRKIISDRAAQPASA
jgi:hypothetical protein